MDNQSTFGKLFTGLYGNQVSQTVASVPQQATQSPQPSVSQQPGDPSISAPSAQQSQEDVTQIVFQRILERVSQVLTAQDMQKIEELNKDDATGETVKYFIMTKVPNLEAIIQEEVNAAKQEFQQKSA